MNRRCNKHTIEFIKKEFEKRGFTLLSNKYKGYKEKLKYKCKDNHLGEISWTNFQQGHGCKKCFSERLKNKNKLSVKYVKGETIKIAKGYKCLATEYKNAITKIPFRCDKNHIFYMRWNNFKNGQRCKICLSKTRSEKMKKNPINWKGGVSEKNIPLYNTYAYQISFCEEVRKDSENKNYLQVRCTNLECRKWFIPDVRNVWNRITSINSENRGEDRFYCSDECKQSCSIYHKQKYPKGFRNTENDRVDQAEWAKLVKERDDYTCVKCGRKDLPLIAHHIEGLNVNPIESADVDLGITLCSECDEEIHSEIGCRPIDLTKDQLCKGN